MITPSISTSRTQPMVLNPPSSSTIAVSPRLMARTAAKAVRRRDMTIVVSELTSPAGAR
jgi:hypothetical protein